MKVMIRKDRNKLGDEYQDSEEVLADISVYKRTLIIKVDECSEVRYTIPMSVIKAEEIEETVV